MQRLVTPLGASASWELGPAGRTAIYGVDTVGNAVYTELVCPMIVPGHLSTGSPRRDASARVNAPGGVP